MKFIIIIFLFLVIVILFYFLYLSSKIKEGARSGSSSSSSTSDLKKNVSANSVSANSVSGSRTGIGSNTNLKNISNKINSNSTPKPLPTSSSLAGSAASVQAKNYGGGRFGGPNSAVSPGQGGNTLSTTKPLLNSSLQTPIGTSLVALSAIPTVNVGQQGNQEMQLQLQTLQDIIKNKK